MTQTSTKATTAAPSSSVVRSRGTSAKAWTAGTSAVTVQPAAGTGA